MSIVDIAKKAGVSVGTVSHYINGSRPVSALVSRRIDEVIKESGYVFRMRRPGPKSGGRKGVRSGVVLFLALTRFSPQELFAMPVFPQFFASLQTNLFEYHMSMMIVQSSPGGGMPDMLDRRFCDGVIVSIFDESDEIEESLLDRIRSMPSVWCFRRHADPNLTSDHVVYNNALVGKLAASYLVEKGHTNVICVPGCVYNHSACKEREYVFRASLAELGARRNKASFENVNLLAPGDYYNYVAEKFLAMKKRPSAIFFCTDDCMAGTFMALGRHGFDTSELEMIGCNNDSKYLDLLPSRPASIDIRIDEMGRMAVSRVMSRINGDSTPRKKIVLEPLLISGEDKEAAL